MTSDSLALSFLRRLHRTGYFRGIAQRLAELLRNQLGLLP